MSYIEEKLFSIDLWMTVQEDNITESFVLGFLKIPLGIVQTISAIFLLIFPLPASTYLFMGSYSYEKEVLIKSFAFKHICHGLSNIVFGIFESTLLGTCIMMYLKNQWKINLPNFEDHIEIEYDNLPNLICCYAKYDSTMRYLNPRAQVYPYYTYDKFKNWIEKNYKLKKERIEYEKWLEKHNIMKLD